MARSRPFRLRHELAKNFETSRWKFRRVRGSEYYYDPEKAIASLWETLAYYDIEPEGTVNMTNAMINRIDENHSESIELNELKKFLNFEPGKKENSKENDVVHAFLEAAVGVEEIDQDDFSVNGIVPTSKIKSYVTLNIKGNTDAPDLTSPSSNLKQYLINKGYEVVDKRDKGGALWLIGGQELTPFISELKQEKIHFTFSYNGSRSTAKRPSWFTTYLN